MPLSRVASVQTTDGPFDLTVWRPDAATGPGLRGPGPGEHLVNGGQPAAFRADREDSSS
jgi:hypothetical protein